MAEPSVGRIVHYMSYGTPSGEYRSEHRAAIITAVSPNNHRTPEQPVVDLCVINPEGMFFNKGVAYSTFHRGGTWHWPEVVE